MAKLTLKNLTKDFGTLRAVDNMSLEVADGEFLVMLGPSGAGKTTTLKLIAGVVNPTSGLIYIGDKVMNSVEPNRRNVAMAFESYALYPHKTVKENLAYPLRAPGRTFPAAEIERRVTAVAETLNIHMLLDRLPAASVQRPETACGFGPGHGPRAGSAAVGRADLPPGCQTAPSHAPGIQGAGSGHSLYDHLCDSRLSGGALAWGTGW